MGIIKSNNKTISSLNLLKGLHLFHANRSNCSARVRLLLEEKELVWTGHHIDLGKKENITEEYFSINPKGVVPTLVYDGEVVNESNDILVYLEKAFPQPGFREVPAESQSEIDYWLKKSTDMHFPGVKTFQYSKINAALIKKSPKEEALYKKLQRDPELLQFHAKHSGDNSFTEEDIKSATALLDASFEKMNQTLTGQQWLVGDAYTLADISWGPTMTTMQGGGYDFSPYTELRRWYEQIKARPQFEKAVLEWRKQATYAAGVDPVVSKQSDGVR